MRAVSYADKSKSKERRIEEKMALYSVSVKTVGRSSGRSSTAAAAYRNAQRIVNERTGEIHDYRRRKGVDYVQAFAPEGVVPIASAVLWNQAEAAEVRKNANVAREVLVALPHELDQMQRRDLAKTIAQSLADRYGTAGTLAIHLPDREGDNRNHHAHILMTTRRLNADGQLGEKTRELDDLKQRGPLEVEWIREMIEVRTNHALERAGIDSRVDRRSLKAQHLAALAAGDEVRAVQLNRPATVHEGPRVTQIRRESVRAGRAPLGALDRVSANDAIRQLVTDKTELGLVTAKILNFEKARQAQRLTDSFWRAPPLPEGYREQRTVSHLDKEALLARLSWETQSDKGVLYRLSGEDAFIDRGLRLEMASGASQSDEKVVAALLTAVDYHRGHIELTGSEAFKSKTIALIARHQIEVTMRDPAQQALLDKARIDAAHEAADLEHERIVAAEMARQRVAIQGYQSERAYKEPKSEPESLDQLIAKGMAEARARVDLHKQIEAGKQQARQTARQWKAAQEGERRAEHERLQIEAAKHWREQEAAAELRRRQDEPQSPEPKPGRRGPTPGR
nr:hypothetical protein PSTH1771_28355 [Pseudomonas syringae pv. theae]